MKELTEDQRTKTFMRELAFWIFGYVLVAIIFLFSIFHLTDAALSKYFSYQSGHLSYQSRYPCYQFLLAARIVFLFDILLTFIIFPICICFRPLRKRRVPIAISIIVLLPISLLLVRFLRIRFLGA